jgi:hypothetical protein
LVDLSRAWGAAPVDPPVVRRKIGIEELLRWACREELPKAAKRQEIRPREFIPGWGSVERYFEYLAEIDDAGLNAFGVVPGCMDGVPHKDSITVAAAVDGLDRFELGLPEDWDPFSDLGEMGGCARR